MKSKEYKSKTKLLIAANLFLIFALMTVAVYAWFASHADNRIDAYDIVVESNNALELSFDQKTWGGSLDLSQLENTDGTKVLDTIKFIPVTGNGLAGTLKIPQLIQEGNYAKLNVNGNWKNAVANKDYLRFTVHMRSKEQLKVYLSSDSQASPASSIYVGKECGNPSSYAINEKSFSKDCIVGALRVSFYDESRTPRIWITNPEFHLTNNVGSNYYEMDTNAIATNYGYGQSVETSNYPYYWNVPTTHIYNTGIMTDRNGLYVSNYSFYELPDTVTKIPQDTKTLIATLATKNSQGYYTDSAEFIVWIEGCDTEARRALVDGKFNLSLVLDSFNAS